VTAVLWLIGSLVVSASAQPATPESSTTTVAVSTSTVTSAPATTSSTQHERQVSENADDERETQEQRTREPVTVNQFCRSCGENAGNQQPECCDSGPNITDWIMAGLTLALVILGAALGFRQIDLMDGSLKTARAAAEAANTQAQSAAAALAHQISQERPWLTMKGDGTPRFYWHPAEDEARTAIIFVPWSMTNVGKDAAWLYQRTVKIIRIDDLTGPPDEPPAFEEERPFGDMPIPPGAAHAETAAVHLDARVAKDIGPGLNALMAYGIIRYRDTANVGHFTRFCFIWRMVNPRENQWHYSPVGPPAYVEYT
jgi:hypothetical protein